MDPEHTPRSVPNSIPVSKIDISPRYNLRPRSKSSSSSGALNGHFVEPHLKSYGSNQAPSTNLEPSSKHVSISDLGASLIPDQDSSSREQSIQYIEEFDGPDEDADSFKTRVRRESMNEFYDHDTNFIPARVNHIEPVPQLEEIEDLLLPERIPDLEVQPEVATSFFYLVGAKGPLIDLFVALLTAHVLVFVVLGGAGWVPSVIGVSGIKGFSWGILKVAEGSKWIQKVSDPVVEPLVEHLMSILGVSERIGFVPEEVLNIVSKDTTFLQRFQNDLSNVLLGYIFITVGVLLYAV